ncbi:hypothetical protein ABG768_010658, partial [Culter alburnus]
ISSNSNGSSSTCRIKLFIVSAFDLLCTASFSSYDPDAIPTGFCPARYIKLQPVHGSSSPRVW